ncbi:MAG TPA: site-specific DNA-methyltransferase, partial [Armatimonadota bacterium]|nr:site-specific DNA-methyltransferase [Armatimonadota bacterium]
PAAVHPVTLCCTDLHEGPGTPLAGARGRLFWGDNLEIMAGLLPDFRGKIDLIYLDPPFAAGRVFTLPAGPDHRRSAPAAYRDLWPTAGDYLQMLYERLLLTRELLRETGSLIVHVNWRVAHLVQLLLDEVFGPGERQAPGRPGFRNEIVWGYGGGGSVRTAYRRKHDNLFWYTRSDRWTFNPQYRPYSEGTRQRGLTAVKGDRYRLRDEGAQLETWWTDPGVQKILSPTAEENLKYPTQKPESLLERIITGHSNPGDLVADFFCGSGTTGAVAERLGRRWLMADESPQAIRVTRKRLVRQQEHAARSGHLYRAWEVWRSLASPAPATGSPAPALQLTHRPDGLLALRLLACFPDAAENRPDPAKNGLDGIDYWAVDWDYQPPVFRHRWTCAPGKTGQIRPEAAIPAHGECIAVRVVDRLGIETTTVLETGPGRPHGIGG